jgi:hypothetical protein
VTPSRPNRPDEQAEHHPEWKQKAEAFFAGEMSETERAAFEREMAANPRRARDVDASVGMGPIFHEAVQAFRIRHLEAHARISDRSVSKHVPWWGRTRSRLLLTVVVAALVFLVIFVTNLSESPKDRFPAHPPATAGYGGFSPAGEVEALPTQFTWTPHPEASQYRFEILDDSSQLVYSTLTAGNTLIVALDALADKGFRSGTWRVVPLDRHGSELEPSRPIEIHVAPR